MTHAYPTAIPEPGDAELLCQALKELLVERGLLGPAEVAMEIRKLEQPGPHVGGRIVARAWVDPAFRARLLANGKEACAELDVKVGEAQIVVVENVPGVHNLITCTLCSCYPRSLLGQPPAWYRGKAYRARSVREPRAMLEEFGTTLDAGTRVDVHDSNADMRYLVLPMRPPGTEGWDEDALASLVTREALVGIAVIGPP
jgi:nitrile hydratase